MSFFIRSKGKFAPDASSKRHKPFKKGKKFQSVNGRSKKNKHSQLDEEITSDEEIGSADDQSIPNRTKPEVDDEEHSEDETVEQKRLRLAKDLINQVRAEDDARTDAQEEEEDEKNEPEDSIKEHTKQLEELGRLHYYIADQIENPATTPDVSTSQWSVRGHKRSITAIALSHDGLWLYSASKDFSLVKWDLTRRRRACTVEGVYSSRLDEEADAVDDIAEREQEGGKARKRKAKAAETHTGHRASVLALALSSDGLLLASGDALGLIILWDAGGLARLHVFHHFRDHGNKKRRQQAAVTGLVFRINSHQLYSCGADRAIRVWECDQHMLMETLFGHEATIQSLDALSRERCVSAGGLDRTARLWKIPEESQLVFKEPSIHFHNEILYSSCSIECVAYVDDEYFLTGSDNNTISLWTVQRRRPIFSLHNAHYDPEPRAASVSTSASAPQQSLVLAAECEPATLVRMSWQRAVMLRASELRTHALASTESRKSARGQPRHRSLLPAGIRLFGGAEPAVPDAPKVSQVLGTKDDNDDDDGDGGGEGGGDSGVEGDGGEKGDEKGVDKRGGVRVRVPPSDRWICSLATVPFGDLFASGSSDGSIRLWKLSFVPHAGAAASRRDQSWQHVRYTAFAPLFSISLPGIINSLRFSGVMSDTTREEDECRLVLAAGVGTEHRLGRWVAMRPTHPHLLKLTPGELNRHRSQQRSSALASNGIEQQQQTQTPSVNEAALEAASGGVDPSTAVEAREPAARANRAVRDCVFAMLLRLRAPPTPLATAPPAAPASRLPPAPISLDD